MIVVDDANRGPVRRAKDGRSWRIGGGVEVAWIAGGTAPGLAVTSAIPPVFDAYATIVVPDGGNVRNESDRIVLAVLRDASAVQPWWLGYLDTGADDVVFPDTPMVTLYTGWRYVLVEAGPDQAAEWKDRLSWRGVLPDVIFPADRSWLISTLWDDDWRCVGGTVELVERLQSDARLDVRIIGIGEDATPPGHQAR